MPLRQRDSEARVDSLGRNIHHKSARRGKKQARMTNPQVRGTWYGLSFSHLRVFLAVSGLFFCFDIFRRIPSTPSYSVDSVAFHRFRHIPSTPSRSIDSVEFHRSVTSRNFPRLQ